jgi:hypothetical protein
MARKQMAINDDQRNLIAQFILSWRNSGHFLPYEDHEVIDEWLRINHDTELLLKVLSEILPGFYQGKNSGSKSQPLKLISRRVTSKIRKS